MCESFDDHGLRSFSVKGILLRTSSLAKGILFGNFSLGKGMLFGNFGQKSHTLVIPVKKPKDFIGFCPENAKI